MAVRTGLERPEVAVAETPAHPLGIPGLWAQAGAKRRSRDSKASRARSSVRRDAGADDRAPRGADASARGTKDNGRARAQEERPPDQG